MKKVLFVATVVKKHIMVFHLPYLEWLKKNGYETHVCARNDYENKEDCNIPYCDKYIDLPFLRSPFKIKNIMLYKKLKELINQNEYDIIHCHTPMGGVLTRLAAIEARKKGTKIIYTAHGFHFFDGAPLINWLFYYPVERFLAKDTDVLITINKEDYNRAKNSFRARKVEFTPGVGIDTSNFSSVLVDKKAKRKELGLPDDAFVILSVGEINKNKNHETIIRAIKELNHPQIYYIICGQGPLESHLKNLIVNLGVEGKVQLLGFRKDIAEICKSSDAFAFPSLREGLGLAAIEAMASGLPIITSNVHGIVDYSVDSKTGYTCNPKDVKGFARAIEKLIDKPDNRIMMGQYNIEVAKRFNINTVLEEVKRIYRNV
ncbi:glycosyltransferase family 4 protein [Bacillus sp. m3-13]|uniref:glycosyltransferase family 4 protein n=1 Tax=Bacillus sp. m3-13 TaxID=406124 RepID=UPI0001E89E12|nr:glycosyltransferase family 4 protein [Bacillus sp. m3-13]